MRSTFFYDLILLYQVPSFSSRSMLFLCGKSSQHTAGSSVIHMRCPGANAFTVGSSGSDILLTPYIFWVGMVNACANSFMHGWTIGEMGLSTATFPSLLAVACQRLAPYDRMQQNLPLLHFELGLFHLTYRFSRFITRKVLITSVLFVDSRSIL